MVCFEEGNQREELYDMWNRIFHDTILYTDFYFNEVYGKNEILLEEEEGQLRGMLHLNPYSMHMGQESIPAHYIVGVSTEEEYRRQGVMRNLLSETFQVLRERKEAFTYLMPAEEDYYLPFSFRFGMKQYEQEVKIGSKEEVKEEYSISRLTPDDYQEIVMKENAWKKKNYAISTEISPDYLHRLSEEVRSEFGLFFCVRKGGQVLGRFVAYAEDDNISVSQMVCYETDLRKEFLQQMLYFFDHRYHFRRYKITYPEDWQGVLFQSKEMEDLQVFYTKEYPIIMFRILNLESMAKWLKCKEDLSCLLMVKDAQIADQEGIYLFEAQTKTMSIQKISQEEADEMGGINGSISIADLTSRIFGNLDGGKDVPDTFDEKASFLWKNLEALAPIDIPEIV